ncbi:MAG: type II toxin-antitoxin system RelE/ParE family toxin [Alphaproteobacteria bacterium]
MRLVISGAARDDLKSIARYSKREWGAARQKRYMAAIRDRFIELLRHPEMGTRRRDLGTAYRNLAVGRHVIFYRIAGNQIIVVRVLHQRMDVRLHF